MCHRFPFQPETTDLRARVVHGPEQGQNPNPARTDGALLEQLVLVATMP
jgi:hypothetical protein